MGVLKSTGFICVLTACLISGCNNYNRQEGCYLDKLHVNGNVVKIESIVQSTVPETELYFNAVDYKSAITMFGNVSIDFDNHGNIKRYKGYGIDGELLFFTNSLHKENKGNAAACVLGKSEISSIDNIETQTNSNGDAELIKYYNKGDLVWTQHISYNDDGSVKTIIKEYESIKKRSSRFKEWEQLYGKPFFPYADTNIYNYIQHDSLNNWTEVEVEYRGVQIRHNQIYRVKRQITYFGEAKKSPLIDELVEYNSLPMYSTDQLVEIPIGKYGNMRIPHYMAEQSQEQKDLLNNAAPVQLNTLFLASYDNSEAYASIIIQHFPNSDLDFNNLSQSDLKYDADLDNYLKNMYEQSVAQNNVYILKWLPYRFVKISGMTALQYRYYRYGTGSPIPVYCENYTIPLSNGGQINIVTAFQSNQYNRFYNDFQNAINSISFINN